MSNTVYDIDFTRALPEPLKNDSAMLALGKAIAAELQENIHMSRLAIIYARLDELDENLLDILARDFHVDWYEDNYPVEAKRQVIKDSVKVHKRLGTKYAMTTALGSVFPHTEVQEWFEYGGTHHCFRIILDFTSAKAPADIFQILRVQEFYKRLTAHLDELIIQMSAVIEVTVETTIYRYQQGMTGQYNAGTRPRRNTIGGVADANINIAAGAAEYEYQTPRAGTKPQRSTLAGLLQTEIEAEDSGEGFEYKTGMTGQYSAGTEPKRNTRGGIIESEVNIETTGAGYEYQTPQAGTKPQRSNIAALRETQIEAEDSGEGFEYKTGFTGRYNAGTEPQRNTKLKEEEAGGMIPVITAETFSYRVRYCGTSKTKNK